MKITLESTDKIVELETWRGIIPARLWQGRTESGIEIHAFITRIGVHKDADASQFEAELIASPAPRPANEGVRAYPTRLLIDPYES